MESPKVQRKLYKRTLLIVSISQIFGGIGLAAGITVGALLAKQILGTNTFTGLPATLFTLGSAGSALLVGKLSQNYGRNIGLTTGFFVGGLGAFGVVIAAIINNIFLLFASLFIYGAGTATNLQARYAGTDLANTKQRATAISIVLVSTTFGAFAGPNLVEVMGDISLAIGIPNLAGPFLLSGIVFILAGLVIFIFLRPDPLLIAKSVRDDKILDTSNLSVVTNNKKGITIGAMIMIITHMVMIAIMTMTPIHMEHNGFSLREIGFVIGTHIASMYLPSIITGVLVDKYGRVPMAIAAAITMLIAGLIAANAPGDSIGLVLLSLSLLGIGWNLGLISGTALVADSTVLSTSAKTQGTVDVFVALAGATGGAISGVIVAGSSYTALSLTGGILSLLLLPAVVWSRRKIN